MVNASVIERAHRRGSRILLNAAPAHALSLDLLQQVDVLVVNATEAVTLAHLLGWPTAPVEFAASACASNRGALIVIVTLGAEGALAVDRNNVFNVRPPAIQAVDTTGAGDAFVGVLACALDARTSLSGALRAAVTAGTLACGTIGAQTAMPYHDAITELSAAVTVEWAAPPR